MQKLLYAKFAVIATVLTLIVVVFGAYVRLSDAGLGCPDWPGCYGHVGVPETPEDIAKANMAHPERPVEPAKAWKEMYHRYLASGLGLLVIMLAVMAWTNTGMGLPILLPTSLVALVIFQGLLGMWTVTLLVKPLVVTAHLAGGLATLMLLWWLAMRTGRYFVGETSQSLQLLRPWLWLGLVLVVLQILLGGWTSTNYAAAACIEFPTCYGGMWWPPTDFEQAFTLWRGLGVNYEGGVLDNSARVAIQLAHRIGAVIVLFYVVVLSLHVMLRARTSSQVSLGVILHFLMLAQVALGIAVVLNYRQLEVAVAHNGVAALLLLTLLSLIHIVTPPNKRGVTPKRAVVS